MNSRTISIVIGAAIVMLIVCMGAVASCGASTGGLAFACSGDFQPPDGGHGADALRRFDSDQIANAAIIADVGATRKVPVWGWVIAVAVAIQESGLHNLPYLGAGNDHDSIGLFQQRPSQGWGTPEQHADPRYAAGKFYDKLLTVPGWQHMPLTDAAQAVQKSAYPDAYAKQTTDAAILVATVGSSEVQAMSVDLEQCLSSCPGFVSIGASTGSPQSASTEPARCEWVAPVLAPVVSGFRTVERPQHNGVDLGASRGTTIRAASSGVVVMVRCNVVPADYGCDRDGSPSTPGCGWYVDVLHPGQVVTRYCHMLSHPFVHEGQSVVAGQVIGVVGSSGHSSGPHLHFETRVGDRGEGAAVDPVVFMRARGVVLGEVG